MRWYCVLFCRGTFNRNCFQSVPSLYSASVRPLQDLLSIRTSCANFLRLLRFISCVNVFLRFSRLFRQERKSHRWHRSAQRRNLKTPLRPSKESRSTQLQMHTESHWLSFPSPAVAWAWIGSVRQTAWTQNHDQTLGLRSGIPFTIRSESQEPGCEAAVSYFLRVSSFALFCKPEPQPPTKRIPALYVPASRCFTATP